MKTNQPPLAIKPNLSQSLLKDYYDYYSGDGCGLYIWNKHFLKLKTEPTAVMQLGIYFEYKATGYVRQGDEIPKPILAYQGSSREDIAKAYQRADESAILFKEMVKAHGIIIKKFGNYLFHEGASGITDMEVLINRQPAIIDIKYSGLIDDKWSEYGWHTESLPQKKKLMLQPAHYKYLKRKIEGIHNIPFYYWVFSSQKPQLAKIIRVDMEDEVIDMHEEHYVERMKRRIDYHFNDKNQTDLVAKPSYARCLECPYNAICDQRITVPQVEEIQFSTFDM